MSRRIFRSPFLPMLLLGLSLRAGAGWSDMPPRPGPHCDPGTVLVEVTDGQVMIRVEIADDRDERARGLMGRTALGPLSGMLFVYEAPQTAWFWMKNTPLPLDMVFIDATGTVRDIVAGAKPYDETPVGGAEGILAVLEIAGGEAARLGITKGSRVLHPLLPAPPGQPPCPR